MYFVLLLVGFGLCSGQTISSTQKIKSNFHYEETCSRANGYCILAYECHHPVDEESKSLCPTQQSEGAVCCKDFPMSDVNCRQLHNECKDSNCTVNIGNRGCPGEQLCCVLL